MKKFFALTVMVAISSSIAVHMVSADQNQTKTQNENIDTIHQHVSYVENAPQRVSVKSTNSSEPTQKLALAETKPVVKISRGSSRQQDFSKLSVQWKRGVEKQIANMKRYDHHLRRSATQNNVSYNLLVAFGVTESGGNARATSHTNVRGLMQVTQSTFAYVGMKGADRTNPANSIEASARYFNELKKEGCTTHELQAVGYNAGCSRAKNLSPRELKQTEYVQKINYVLQKLG